MEIRSSFISFKVIHYLVLSIHFEFGEILNAGSGIIFCTTEFIPTSLAH